MGNLAKNLFGDNAQQTFVAAPEIPAPPAATIDTPTILADVSSNTTGATADELQRRYRPQRTSTRLGTSGTGLSV